MKKTFAFITGIIFIFSAMGLSAQNTWSLQECIDYALENNIQIKQQGLNTQYNENLVHHCQI